VVEEAAHGANGIVFRARSGPVALAATVSQVDGRGRAARELAALTAMAAADLGRAPRPLGVTRLDGVDVLFSEWCDGLPLPEAPPPGTEVWERVAEAYAEVRGRCDATGLEPTVLGVDFAQVVEDLRRRLRLFDDPDGERVASAAERSVPADLPPARPALVHCEASLANFLLGEDGELTIVDWENSGSGDACFDPANVVTAPQHAQHPPEAWDGLFVRHAQALGDERLAGRTRAHARVMAAWWVVRLRQEQAAPTRRLAGVAALAGDLLGERLQRCEERAAAVLGL
jgi:hypothetical protein